MIALASLPRWAVCIGLPLFASGIARAANVPPSAVAPAPLTQSVTNGPPVARARQLQGRLAEAIAEHSGVLARQSAPTHLRAGATLVETAEHRLLAASLVRVLQQPLDELACLQAARSDGATLGETAASTT